MALEVEIKFDEGTKRYYALATDGQVVAWGYNAGAALTNAQQRGYKAKTVTREAYYGGANS